MAEALDAQKTEKYSHLTDAQFAKLRALVYRRAEALYIDGSAPSTMLNYKFDIELLPGADPVKQKMPKYSSSSGREREVPRAETRAVGATSDADRCTMFRMGYEIAHRAQVRRPEWQMDHGLPSAKCFYETFAYHHR